MSLRSFERLLAQSVDRATRHPDFFASGCSFNHWHQHVDWNSKGRESPRHRQAELKALFELHRRVRDMMSHYSGRYQQYLLICQADPGQDAVYLHSKNPYTPFPNQIAAQVVDRVPQWLRFHVDMATQVVARMPGRRVWYLVEDRCLPNKRYERTSLSRRTAATGAGRRQPNFSSSGRAEARRSTRR